MNVGGCAAPGTKGARVGDLPYCKIYLRGLDDPGRLRERVAGITGGILNMRTVQTPGPGGLLIDVFTRPASRLPTAADGEDFLDWPAYLEIEPVVNGQAERQPVFIAEVARLVHGLQQRGLRSVVACDFEAELDRAVQALHAQDGAA